MELVALLAITIASGHRQIKTKLCRAAATACIMSPRMVRIGPL
jgi:hypothetical protein